MNRSSILAYGIMAYLVFLGTFLYAMGFLANMWVPKSIDSGSVTPLGLAILVNTLLLSLFAVQHSIMARPAFKKWWERWVPSTIERSTYVLFSSLALIALFIFWRPMPGNLWRVDNQIGQTLLWSLYGFGWLLVLASSFMINHFDLFGLRQVWLAYRQRDYTHLSFKTPWLYNFVRHPLYVGWFLVMWMTPDMSQGHLFFALIATSYILIAVRLEERDLTRFLAEYADYKARVPRFFPRFNKGADKDP